MNVHYIEYECLPLAWLSPSNSRRRNAACFNGYWKPLWLSLNS